MIKILIFQDGKPISEFSQTDGRREISIGRAPGCLIRLDDDAISRLHAIIRQAQGQWIVERRANFGAVLVNGQEVENAVLQGGEEIQVGPYSLRVQLDEIVNESPSFNVEEGRTKVLSGGGSAQGLFRFEPGAANVGQFVMEGQSAIFGRASNCDVVLLDKKASRKHIEVRRDGLAFYVRDLNSANGTLLNEKKLTQETELTPGDYLQVGESKFQFTVENKDFFAGQQDFLPIPSSLATPAEIEETAQPFGDQPDFEQAQPPPPPEAPEKSLFKRLHKKFFALPRHTRLLILAIIAIGSSTLFYEEDKPQRPTPPPVKRDEKGQVIRTFDMLSKDKKEMVQTSYKQLVEAQGKKDYRKMLELVQKISAVVDEFRDLKAYETIAKRGIEEEEKRERERIAEEKRQALAREVAALEAKGKEIFQKALKSPEARPELTAIVQEIYGKDPNNQLAQGWTEAIKQKQADEEREREIAQQKAQLKQKAEGELTLVENLFKENRYKDALAASEKLQEIGYSEGDYLQRVGDLQKRIRERLAEIIDPLLKEANTQRADGGDLVKANELFLEILKIDSGNRPAVQGLESIRETLHSRAQRFYFLAVLSESISDLVDAKDKFSKCLKTAPEDDIYKERCKSKLARYEVYHGNDATSP